MRRLRGISGRNDFPIKRSVYRVVKDFEDRGYIDNRPKHACSKHFINPPTDALLRSLIFKRQLFSQFFTRIFIFFPSYMSHLTQGFFHRPTNANKTLQLGHGNSDIHNKIIMSNEAHFHLNGYENNKKSILVNEKPSNFLEVWYTI